jgi:hypothetical protein
VSVTAVAVKSSTQRGTNRSKPVRENVDAMFGYSAATDVPIKTMLYAIGSP